MIRTLSTFATLLFVGASSVSAGSGGRAQRAFPLLVEPVRGERAVQLRPDLERLAELRGLNRVTFRGVPVPTRDGLELVDLVVRRLHVIAPHAAWLVDGRIVGGRAELEADHTLWRGKVAGEPDSSVFLAFTSTGSHGWIERAGDEVQLVSERGEGGWSQVESFLVHESDLHLREEAQGIVCAADAFVQPRRQATGISAAPRAGRVARELTSYECLIACESDYQYYRLFDDAQAATNYAISIWGAVSERFLSACSTRITLPYLAIYTTPDDPWVSPDHAGPPPYGSTSTDLLLEFQAAWGGSPLPGNANLGHFLSGANLGGGLAYLHVLCDPDYAFSVSTRLLGMTPFPVPLRHHSNYDFTVVAHETGHNFGALHTHEYCPPIDQCTYGPFGPCQTQQVCEVGTIMSYCQGCAPTGDYNVRSVFHPRIGAEMRHAVEGSCLPSFEPAGISLRKGSGVNPLGYTSADAPELGTTWAAQVELDYPGVPFSALAVGGGGPAAGPMTSVGELLIDLSVPLRFLDLGTGRHSVPIPDDVSLLGETVCTQAATFGRRIQLQNALDLYLAY